MLNPKTWLPPWIARNGLFASLFLMPSLMASGSAAAQVMEGLQRRRLFLVMPAVAVLTMLSGLRLMWLTSGGFAAAYFATPSGATFAVSSVAAVIAFFLGLLVSRPLGARTGALAAALAAASNDEERARIAAELDRVRRRSAVAGEAGMWLLILSASGMAIARYMG